LGPHISPGLIVLRHAFPHGPHAKTARISLGASISIGSSALNNGPHYPAAARNRHRAPFFCGAHFVTGLIFQWRARIDEWASSSLGGAHTTTGLTSTRLARNSRRASLSCSARNTTRVSSQSGSHTTTGPTPYRRTPRYGPHSLTVGAHTTARASSYSGTHTISRAPYLCGSHFVAGLKFRRLALNVYHVLGPQHGCPPNPLRHDWVALYPPPDLPEEG